MLKIALFVPVTMVVGEVKRTANIMDGIENTGDVRLHDHRLRLKQRLVLNKYIF
jgi:hypothetical protein